MRASVIPVGTKFGSYTVTGPPVSIHCDRYWPCKCVCGTEKPVKGGNLRSGRSNSCGCQAGERISRAHAARSGRPRKVPGARVIRPEPPQATPAPVASVPAAPEPPPVVLTPAMKLAIAMRRSGARWSAVLEVTGLSKEEVEP